MLRKTQHQLIMGNILKDIYTDVTISSSLGFKGGTCAYFFYGLPRFSVALDFDLLDSDSTTQEQVLEKMTTVLQQYGTLLDTKVKRHTTFFLLSYGDADHKVKVEINTRTLHTDLRQYYKIKEYIGIAMLAGTPEYLFASKLVALSERKKTAMRDVYDIWFFGSQRWSISEQVVQERTQKDTVTYIADCISLIEKIPDNQFLQGLGELLDSEKEKNWVKTKLKGEVLFVLRNYQSSLSK